MLGWRDLGGRRSRTVDRTVLSSPINSQHMLFSRSRLAAMVGRRCLTIKAEPVVLVVLPTRPRLRQWRRGQLKRRCKYILLTLSSAPPRFASYAELQ